ncbi:MAG: hypothetical protein ACTSRE_06815 [Promethearchaeota archaeon]
MAKGNNTGAIVILAILALGGLGLSGYMFVEDRFLGGDEHDAYKLIGVWENLEGSGTDFNITFQNPQYQNNEYFSLSTTNTTFNLLLEGWYKLTISTTWTSLDPTEVYRAYVMKNGVTHSAIFEMWHPAEIQMKLDVELYLYSNSTDSYHIHCYESGFTDPFGLATNQIFNTAYLEYITI